VKKELPFNCTRETFYTNRWFAWDFDEMATNLAQRGLLPWATWVLVCQLAAPARCTNDIGVIDHSDLPF